MGGYIGATAVGLVTTAADVQGDITSTDTTPELILKNTTETDADGGRDGKITFKGEQSGGEESTLAQIQSSHDGSSDDQAADLIFKTNDGSDGASPTERMRIDSAGKVDVTGTVTADAYALDSIAIPSAGTATIFNRNTDNNLYIQTGSGNAVNVLDGSQNTMYAVSPTSHIFQISNAEKMRIDSSGNLIVGKTSTAFGTAGATYAAGGNASLVTSGGSALFLNRLSSDGNIAEFYKDGASVGAIGTLSGDLSIFSTASGHEGLRFGNGAIVPTNNSGASTDNACNLGGGSGRFTDIFASNGTIQTSDENEKQNIASLTSAEITAATAISKLFKTFKWKDAVEAKGDNSRTHSGVIAQQVATAMSDAGLDASKYGFWCSDTWWEKDVEVAAVEADEEKGIEAKDAYTRTDSYDIKDEAPKGATEHTRMGVRYPELLSFVSAATEQRLTSIEARLTALEAE
jgi:hypothetical protein